MTKKITPTPDLDVPASESAPQATAARAAPKIKILAGDSPEAQGDAGIEKVKKPVFIERAMLRTDVKKRDAKPAIEAALAELAAALLAGEELVLPPLGKIKVVRSKELGQGAHALTLKLRTMKTQIVDDA